MGQKVNITLYTAIKDTSLLVEAFQNAFEEVCRGMDFEDNVLLILLQDHSKLSVTFVDDEEEISAQINGMVNYYAQVETADEVLHQAVLTQISLFDHISGVQFEFNENESRTSFILNALFEVAEQTASIVLYPSMSLYTPKGELLLSLKGESGVKNWNPIAHTSILNQQRVYDEADQERFAQIHDELVRRKMPAIKGIMATQLSEEMVDVATAEQITQCFFSVFGCAMLAEYCLNENVEKGLEQFEALNEQYQFASYLSAAERAFVENPQDEQAAMNMTWKYECCAVLLWALGLYGLDATYETMCDVPAMCRIIDSYDSMEAMAAAAHVRSVEELLIMHTRALYYDWSCVEMRIHGQEHETILPGIVLEHHYALNWLLNANQTRDWDRIQCNT